MPDPSALAPLPPQAVVDAAATDWRFAATRLHARLLDDRDRDLVRALYTDPAVMAHVGPAMTPDEADVFFAKLLRWNAETPVRARFWAYCDLGEELSYIGLFSATRIADAPSTWELGQMLLPQRQRRGYALEISVRILDLLMSDVWGLGVEVAVGRHAGENTRLLRIGDALRFERDDPDGQGRETWSLTREEWWARRDAVSDGVRPATPQASAQEAPREPRT